MHAATIFATSDPTKCMEVQYGYECSQEGPDVDAKCVVVCRSLDPQAGSQCQKPPNLPQHILCVCILPC